MKMTYEELLATKEPMISVEAAAGILGCTPQILRIKARDPEKRRTLGFPIMAIGSRVKIPTRGLIKFLEGGGDFIVETKAETIAKQFYDELVKSGISSADKEKVVLKLSELIYDNER